MQPLDYSSVKALSQSALKVLDTTPRRFYDYEYRWLIGEIENKLDKPVTDAMLLGQLVDCLFLTPEEFDLNYIVDDCVRPAPQMLEFVKNYHSLYSTTDLTEIHPLDEDLALSAYKITGFKKDSFENVMLRFAKEGVQYLDFLCTASSDKTVVSSDMYNKAKLLVKQLQDHRYIGEIVRETRYKEFLRQFPIYTDWNIGTKNSINKVKLKGLLDLIVIDHSTRTITVYDLKTTSDSDFNSAFAKYRYDLQASFYTMLLQQYIMTRPELHSYAVDTFKFIVCYTTGRQHEICEVPDNVLYSAAHNIETINGKQYKGWIVLLDRYEWHVSNNLWDFTKEMYSNNGVRELKMAYDNEQD